MLTYLAKNTLLQMGLLGHFKLILPEHPSCQVFCFPAIGQVILTCEYLLVQGEEKQHYKVELSLFLCPLLKFVTSCELRGFSPA